jgi:UDP-2,3-diacylglucosamine hydrolase
MKHWFLSDLHITDINERNGNLLLRFFFFLNQKPSEHTVYFLGDIFDMWLSDGVAFQNHYKFLIEEIRKFKSGGGKLIYFEGNHDFHIDRFWTKQLDIPVYENEGFFQINNLKVRCEHGDYINPDDQVYLAYRENVRRPWMEWLAHNLPSHFWKAIGELYSRKNRSKTSRYAIDNSERVRAMIQAYAMKVYNAEPFDLFDDYTFSVNTRKVRSINLGTWLSEPIVLLIDNDGVRTVNVFSLVNSG